MLQRISAFLLVLTTLGISAQNEIQVNDPQLRNYLLEILDKDSNGTLDRSEALDLIDLSLTGVGVRDLGGLEAFEKLSTIDLSDNAISDLRPLAALPNLAIVSLRNNDISDLSPLLEKEALLATGNLTHRPMIDIEGNRLSSGDCGDLLELGEEGFRAVYGDQKTGLVDCVGKDAVSAKRWIPHITARDGNFETTVILTNDGDGDLLNITPYASDGLPLSGRAIELGADEATVIDLDTLFGEEVSHFSIDGCETCTVTLGYRARNQAFSGTAHVNETRTLRRALTAFAGERDVVFDGAAVVNAGLEPTTVVVRALDSEGKVLDTAGVDKALPPNAKTLIVFEQLFPEMLAARYTIETSQPTAALFLRGSHVSTGASILYQTDERLGLPVPNNATRYITHLTRNDADFRTRLLIVNDSAAEGSLTLQPIDLEGNALAPETVNLKPGTSMDIDAGNLFDQDATHVAITGDDYVSVVVAYKAVTKDSATAHIREQTEFGTRFRLFPGEWGTVWDGAAMVNTGTGPAEILVTGFDDQGVEIFQTTLSDDLAANAKLMVNFQAIMPAETELIEIRANQVMATAFLRGSSVGKPHLLFETSPLIGEREH